MRKTPHSACIRSPAPRPPRQTKQPRLAVPLNYGKGATIIDALSTVSAMVTLPVHLSGFTSPRLLYSLLPKARGPVNGGREFADRNHRGSNVLKHCMPKTSLGLNWAIGKLHAKDGRHDVVLPAR
jgi:hypothetical protein